MRIQCLTTFMDDKDRFEKDDQRSVDDERGARLVANGWAKDVTTGAVAESAIGAVDMNIQHGQIGLGDSNG